MEEREKNKGADVEKSKVLVILSCVRLIMKESRRWIRNEGTLRPNCGVIKLKRLVHDSAGSEEMLMIPKDNIPLIKCNKLGNSLPMDLESLIAKSSRRAQLCLLGMHGPFI